ncbi:MAG: S46 family peptidase [Bacteroidota bacterium]
MYRRIMIMMTMALILGFSTKVKAEDPPDEGMWLPMLVDRLNYADMKKMGLHLTADEIYSINNNSIKDAIILLNNGMCTGFLVSKDGLMMTNYHCAFSAVQKHTKVDKTADKDYITNGFWAGSRNEELNNENLSATFLLRVHNITDQVLGQLNDNMTEDERIAKVGQISNKITTDSTMGTHYQAYVKPFFEGNEYYLFIYETYKDVRLVGVPPQSIGQYGADADNWKWPRQTCDFAMLRIYTSGDGRPAEYNRRNNIPLKSKYYFPVSLKGYKTNDFAVIMGYPGSTTRFMTSYGVKLTLDQVNPTIIKIRDKKLSLMKEDMDVDEKVKVQYASKYLVSSNYWLYYMYQNDILKRLDVLSKKKQVEDDFIKWMNVDEKRKAKYGGVLEGLEKANKEIEKYNLTVYYFKEAILRGPEIFTFANTYEELYNQLKVDNSDKEKIDRLITSLRSSSSKYFKNYNASTDKKIFAALLQMYYNEVPKDQHPAIFLDLDKKYKGDMSKFADEVFSTSMFVNKDKMDFFLSNPSYKEIEKDVAFKSMKSMYEAYYKVLELMEPANLELAKNNRLFVAAYREMYKDKKIYPDANSTMRLTYGKVCDYTTADGKKYKYYTTLDELISRGKPGNPDFTVTDKLREIYNKRDFTTKMLQYTVNDSTITKAVNYKYAVNDTLRTCFLTNNDVTGGYSGSPILNGDGQLIGVVFDINQEAAGNAIAFEPNYQRTMNVDIRYALFIIDKYGNAHHLLNEMKIIP